MSDANAPVAFRLRRPYATEDEFVAGDGACIEKGGMTLVGAGPRPLGLIVRFEVALRDGAPLFRGEGKVVHHRAVGDADRPSGLDVKFTRLDAQGKAIVERVIRERAAAFSPSPSPAIPDLVADRPSPGVPVDVPPPLESGPIPEPSGEVAVIAEGVDASPPPPPVERAAAGELDGVLARLRARGAGALAAPSDRLSLLDRLRARRA